ncbi:MAG: DUF1877 family protein [Pirellulaceae bacterium]|nr:DUF1877 family protein [Pirellulaceae bacterium]
MVGRGYHMALGREHAKRLFAIKDDGALRKFLDELRGAPDMKKSGRLLELGTAWDGIHRCLTDGTLDPTAGDFPLNHAVLGGKQLHQGADYTAVLIRPDMTRFIADALEELDEDEVRKRFFALDRNTYQQPIGEKEFMEIWLALKNLQVFFAAAAESLEAVIFTAKFDA